MITGFTCGAPQYFLLVAFQWLWCTTYQNKRKTSSGFFWKIDSVLENSSVRTCPSVVEESLFHLMLDCCFASACWYTLNLFVPNTKAPFDVLISFRDQLWLCFLHGNYHDYVLVHLDSAKWCHFQKTFIIQRLLQDYFHARICSSYSTSKSKISFSYWPMPRSLGEILFIFFVAFCFLNFVLGYFCF